MKDITISIETTGHGTFNPPKQRIVEISWKYGKDVLIYKVKGQHEINSKVKHNITKNDIENGIEWAEISKNLITYLMKSQTIVSHNIEFLVGSIIHEDKMQDGKGLRKILRQKYRNDEIYCTMKNSVDFCKIPTKYGGYKFPTMDELSLKLFDEKNEHLCKTERIYEVYETLNMIHS